MPNPWEIYDALIDAIPEEVTLTTVNVGAQWTRVINSAGGIGMAWTMNVKTRPDIFPGVTLDGIPLREAAGLIRSWNLAEASIGQAAINSWHSRPETAEANGFVPTGQGINWGMVFDPYTTDVAGKKAIVLDDEIATGGSIVEIVSRLADFGCAEASIACTHGVFSGPARERLSGCGAKEVITTDTLPQTTEGWDNLTVLSMAPLLAKTIREVFENGSVTSLFEGQA